MNSLNSWLPTQWFLLAGLLLAVGVVLVVISMFAWRAISRPHVRGLSKKGRQPRLGVVDSYPVDRNRQLVLVHRDNVEHLIMIGGPNDVLVESTILKSRSAGQASRPPGATAPAPVATPERVSSFPPAPRQVEEDFVRSNEVELPPIAKVEPIAPPPVVTTTAAPVAPPIATPPAAPASSAPPLGRPSVVPPREPGFFQRASSRFQTFKNPSPSAAAATTPAGAMEEEDEPRATIDTAHFEELLGAPEKDTPEAATAAKPAAEFDFDSTDIEPAPEDNEPAPPPPATTRLTLPEIRLPDLKLPEWRRPEPAASPHPAASPEPPAIPTPAPRPAVEARVEPRFASEPRPLGGGRIEPTMTPAEPRPQPTEAPARHEPFRVGERLTTPTRPMPSPPPPVATTQAPAEPEDPFASLEEEMANLLGRTKDDGKKS